MCYIAHDDYISPFFTVDETMTIAAELKLADTISQNTKQEIVRRSLRTSKTGKSSELKKKFGLPYRILGK